MISFRLSKWVQTFLFQFSVIGFQLSVEEIGTQSPSQTRPSGLVLQSPNNQKQEKRSPQRPRNSIDKALEQSEACGKTPFLHIAGFLRVVPLFRALDNLNAVHRIKDILGQISWRCFGLQECLPVRGTGLFFASLRKDDILARGLAQPSG